jgi:hypothetical protein
MRAVIPTKGRNAGIVLRYDDVAWDELTEDQQRSVTHGDACGHPSNRPNDLARAKRWTYVLDAKKINVIGTNIGAISMSGRFIAR